MPLLFEEDYLKLKNRGLTYDEAAAQRFFIFTNLHLPGQLYTVERCDVLVIIPPNYNQAGNDMFWTFPRLQRADGKAIAATLNPGGGDNRIWNGKEFCRWSRHWSPSAWRPGRDDIITIFLRIAWALQRPDG